MAAGSGNSGRGLKEEKEKKGEKKERGAKCNGTHTKPDPHESNLIRNLNKWQCHLI
ncbi:hypothetical protein Csa_010108 [Cucumis sativus]|uniref:Uncharacterized protein n=1 Tax=Cucumis sativus TaxID=3659 RepID=A0A0A0L6E9_CUCSA|nr:hypothetical protein Csa_010108 [Cucumis sativus]